MAHAFMKRNKSQIIMTTAIRLLNHSQCPQFWHPQMSVNLGSETELVFSKHRLLDMAQP